MTQLRATLCTAALSLFFIGCAAQERPVIVETPQRPAPEVHDPAGNAIEAIEAYGYEQQDLVINNIQSILSDLDRRITDLRSRSKMIASDERDDWNEELTELEQTRDELEVLVSRAKFATRDNWDDVKDSVVERLEDVQESLEELQSSVDD